MALVSSKKTIVICKHDGEFDTSEHGLMSYSGGQAKAVDLVDNMQLSDFKQEIAEAVDLTVDEMLVKYFLPGNNKDLITVSKEKDFERMVNYYKDCEHMEVFIMEEAPPAKTQAQKQPPRRPQKRPAETPLGEVKAETQLAEVQAETQLAEVQAETQVAVVQPPFDLGLSGVFSLNEFIDIETTNEIMASVPQISVNSFSMSTNDNEQHLAAKQWENLITGVGQRFHSLAEFRETLRKYSIAHGFNYMYKKNENERVTVKCKSEGCPWRIHASRLSTTQLVCIKTMTPTHTCQGGLVKPAFRATRSWIGNLIKEKVRDSPKIKPKDIAFDLKRDYGIELNYSQARRAKEYAREQLLGSYKDAYSELPFFCEKLIETNPGSHVTCCTNEDSSFRGLFVSFYASISGFVQGCPQLLFLDSTPLNSRFQGTLLTAMSVDGNDEVFPVAFGVIDVETDDNWRWFLTELRNALPEHLPITFVADFQRGLRESIPDVFGSQCHHAYCLGYLAEKFVKDLTEHFSHEARRLMVEDLYAAAQATKVEVFEKYTQDIRAISPEAYNWIINSEPEHWANCSFEGLRFNHMTANFGKGFYSWVSEADELPITQLVDELRGKMMELIYKRRVESINCPTQLTPIMDIALNNETLKAQSVRIFGTQGDKVEVQFGEIIDVVEVENWICTCGGWLLNGPPCCHAIAVMNIHGTSIYNGCARHCLAETWRAAYANSINPVPYLERLADVEVGDGAIVVTPPATVRTPGRAKIRKVAGLDGPVGPADFLKRVLQCGKCKGLGHNKRSCKEDL